MPLHWAVSKKASVEVVRALLEAHEQAAETADEVRSASNQPPDTLSCVDASATLRAQADRLPLHEAAANQASEEVIWLLLRAHPEAAKAIDSVRPPCCVRSHASDPHGLCMLTRTTASQVAPRRP